MPCFLARLDEKRCLQEIFDKTLKSFVENSIEKLNYYYILFLILFFENLFLTLEPSEITPFSTKIFSVSRDVSLSPGYALAAVHALYKSTDYKRKLNIMTSRRSFWSWASRYLCPIRPMHRKRRQRRALP